MRNSTFISASSIVVGLLAAAPATAADWDAVSVTVAVAGLDLGDAADAARLDRRLVSAADAACAGSGRGIVDRMAFTACKDRALTTARAQARRVIETAMARADGTRIAGRR